MTPGFIEIGLPEFRIHVVVTWETNKKDIIDYAKRHGIKITPEKWGVEFEYHVRDLQCQGLTMPLGDDNVDVLVWLRKRPKKASAYGTLYHELFHATRAVAKARNMMDEEEAQAFIYEHLAAECARVFWRQR